MQRKKKRALVAVQTRVSPETHAMLKTAAKADGRSVAAFLRVLLSAWANGAVA